MGATRAHDIQAVRLGSKSISIRFGPLITRSITSLAGSPTRLSAG